jgi:DNA-binding response OmpR family regulator
MRLLLVEDTERLAGHIRDALAEAGFAVDWFARAADAIGALDTVPYDGIVLDLGLPDADGTVVLAKLRDGGQQTPVLILTARDTVEQRVEGLNAGADDYLTKPFAMAELVARVRAMLRRPGGSLGKRLAVGNLAFDTATRDVTVGGKALTMPRHELSILEQLMRRQGRVVAKGDLENRLYSFEDEIASNSVEVHMHRLRKRLSNAGADVAITTLRGIGYLLDMSEGA